MDVRTVRGGGVGSGAVVLASLVLVAVGLVACGQEADGGEVATESIPSSPGAEPDTTSPDRSFDTRPPSECAEWLALRCGGSDVERLQRLLRSRVDGRLGVDGSLDEVTEEILRDFEESCDVCTPDGRIEIDGPEWKALEKKKPATTTTDEISP